MSEQKIKYQKVLDFWFTETQPKQWFAKSEKFDKEIYTRFYEEHKRARHGELVKWRDSIEGCLAEIILLDQFSRNMYRNQPRSFAYDGMALVLAQEAVKREDVKTLNQKQRAFLYMPFMHSESLVIHESALNYFNEAGLEKHLKQEKKHRAILVKFGRYPHRNEVLGRKIMQEEVAFLKQPRSSF